jgi:predicted dehydrogenase
MSSNANPNSSRREFLQNTGRVAAATALAGLIVPKVHAADSNTINVALIGCGGRGTGAAANALSTQNGPIKLIAMADVFPHRLAGSYGGLHPQFADKMDVPDERKFIGFDGYQKAMDCLKPGDIAIFTTPVAFRWVHFGYAIQKGLNVFMEKPVTTDGPTSKRMLALAEESKKKNLKVGVGLMCRHCKARGELSKRIKDGEIGDITLLRAYRMSPPVGSCFTGPKPKDASELLWQIERFHSFLWASGGSFSDFLIHNLDECCWMKDAWPVKAQALGGRHYRGDNIDQNFDTYSVEYTFGDGAKLLLDGRNIANCYDEFASYAHGTKGSAVISTSSHSPAKSRIYKTQNIGKKDDLVWAFGPNEPNPYQVEWDDLVAAIRSDTPYNEVERGVQASLVTSMGRMAAHTGQEISYDDMLNCTHEFAPTVDKLTLDSAAPLVANAQGKYPVPQPGITTKREYA